MPVMRGRVKSEYLVDPTLYHTERGKHHQGLQKHIQRSADRIEKGTVNREEDCEEEVRNEAIRPEGGLLHRVFEQA